MDRQASLPDLRRRLAKLPLLGGAIQGNALAVERFDRAPDGGHVHREDFAQGFGQFPEDKSNAVSYANIARVLCAETGEQGPTNSSGGSPSRC